MTVRERALLRELATRGAEVAALPVQAERRARWVQHNRLQPGRPMILLFPEGAWRELLPESVLQCQSETARGIEWELRRRLYYRDHLDDDTVIEGNWVVSKVIHSTGWGLESKHTPSTEQLGAWAFDPVILGPADLKKLHAPEITYDEAATQARLEFAQELFGDILQVQLKGVAHVSFHLLQQYSYLRGLQQTMVDMATEPGLVHEAMAIFADGNRRLIDQYVAQNLLSLNNDGTYHSSGGVGYTTELPAPGFDPARVRPRDMWVSAESQELAQVSPAMHAEFALAYERPLLEPFGLAGYGCCEDLTRKLPDVMAIPNMRRISIAPFADVEKCAEQMGGRFIFSWKAHPAHLAAEFHPEQIRAYLQHTLDVTRGCVLEMILKDTHTCNHHPERFTEWTRLARELVEAG